MSVKQQTENSRLIRRRIIALSLTAIGLAACAILSGASRAADYMHGAIVPVDGGWLAR